MKRFPKPIVSQIGRTERHVCRRCKKTLPWDHFGKMGRGVARKGTHLLYPFCFRCRSEMKGLYVQHELYSIGLDRFFQQSIVTLKGGAYSRGLYFGIDKDDVLGLYLMQRGLCALSGVKMEHHEFADAPRGSEPSVDRIDSSGHYTPDNIQIVCRAINIMKMAMGQTEFIGWCQRVASNTRRKEDQLLDEIEGEGPIDSGPEFQH